MTEKADVEGTVAWRELLAEATARLGGVDTPSAALDARRIVGEVSGHDGTALVLALDEQVTERQMARFDQMVSRRLAGEPLQYVLGRWGFRTLDLAVDRRALIPRPETETVVDVALAHLDRIVAADAANPDDGVAGREHVAVDLGTGTGAIALSIAVERPGTVVWATDASADALNLARANLAGLGRAARLVQMSQGSWFEALPPELVGSVSVIVSNPPYVAESDEIELQVVDWEPHAALFARDDGLADLIAIAEGAHDWLRPSGALIVELAPFQVDRMVATLVANRFVDVEVHRDLAGRDRAISAVRAASTAE